MSIDDGKYAIGIFLDLSKAFDTINHKILFDKLYRYGIRGNALDWIKSYLSNRYQQVVIGDAISDKCPITCGVPHGSVLGPLLFLLYINDICECSKTLLLILFADDTSAFISGDDPITLTKVINDELIILANWFKVNKLSINLKKTNYILFSGIRKKVPFKTLSVTVDDIKLENVTSAKFLGVIIEKNLNWAEHIHTVENKISKTIGILYKLGKILDKSILKLLYSSLILPYLQYCTMIWASGYPSKLKKLITLQKRAIRGINGVGRFHRSTDLFKEDRLLKLPDICHMQLITFMFRHRHGMLPKRFDTYFKTKEQIHQYETRTKTNYQSTTCRSNTRLYSAMVLGPKLWNSLPQKFKIMNSLVTFKISYKQFLISGY